MPKLDKIISVGMLVRIVVGKLLYRRLISRIITIIVLAVMTGMLTGTLLAGGSYAIYLALVRHGLDMDTALLATGGMVALATLLCALLTRHFIHKLWHALLPIPNLPQVRRMTKAFMDGFTESSHENHL